MLPPPYSASTNSVRAATLTGERGEATELSRSTLVMKINGLPLGERPLGGVVEEVRTGADLSSGHLRYRRRLLK